MSLKNSLYIMSAIILVTRTEVAKDDVDKVIEDEITHKLGDDLVQSIERKFQVDLERSVEMVLIKIRLLLQNGTEQIQEKLLQLQSMMDMIRSHGVEEVETCLADKQNDTSTLAEKALHQMVICGYALIGQDPSKAIRTVANLKNKIRDGVKPLNEQKNEIYGLLRACGHDHDSLKKVIKCVISRSPLMKSTMMDINGKLIDGVVDLTKQMAHGAMHEACLIEVIKSIEDEAMEMVEDVKKCAFKNITFIELDNFIADNNATVLDIENKKTVKSSNVSEVETLLRRVLDKENAKDMDSLKDKLKELHRDLSGVNNFVFDDNKNE